MNSAGNTTDVLLFLEILAIFATGLSLWLAMRAQERKRQQREIDRETQRIQRDAKLEARLTSSFTSLEKDLHGVSVTVGPYAQQIKSLEDKTMNSVDRISKLEANCLNRTSDTERMQREIEAFREQMQKVAASRS